MKKRFIRNKKVRHATVAATLTVMVILVAVLANAVLSSVVERYDLYTSLTPTMAFDVTDDCYTLLESRFEARRQAPFPRRANTAYPPQKEVKQGRIS